MTHSPVAPVLPATPMDPAFAGFLAQAAAQGHPPMETLPPPVGRQVYRDMAAALCLPAPPVASVTDRSIPGPGGPMELRLYAPVNALASPLPLVLYVHGGGWVIGDLETHDAVCRRLCHDSGTLVAAVNYRLAPEHPFPAAHDDVEAALRYLHANAAALGADPRRMAIAGDSAGAHLALVAARRTAGAVPLRGLGLIYPVAQHYADGGPCYAENDGKFLTAGVMKWFSDCYTAQRPEVIGHKDFALLRHGGFAGLPPTWVATMGHDPLRDEGHQLALRMQDAGVPVTHRHYAGAIHACIHFTAVSPVGAAIVEEMAGWARARV